MKSFKFQQFELKQSKNVFRIGTDAVLLGALVNISAAKHVLEIGSGSGIISLMLAQRFPETCILGLDINPEAAALSDENFSHSKFSHRLKAIYKDFKNLELNFQLDAIVTNPPFFEANNSTKDVLARQKIELTYHDIVAYSQKLLTDNGSLSVIIPSFDEADFINIAQQHQLYLSRKINIRGIVTGDVKRVILEFNKVSKKIIIEDFVIEKAPRMYSDQYLEATKDFHVFTKK